MNTLQINSVLKKFPSFQGVFPCDLLPDVKHFPSSYVINSAPHTHRGEHWLAAYFASPSYGEYFDSYGLPAIEPRIRHWLLKNAKSIKYSNTLLQDLNHKSDACGPFVICYIALKDQGLSLEDIISYFYKTLPCNDMIAVTLARIFNDFSFKKDRIQNKR